MTNNGTSNEASPTIHPTISMEDLAALIRRRGFRAETLTDAGGGTVIRSASSGIAFHARPGNQAAAAGTVLDFTFFCVLQADAPIPESFANAWNAGKRFARLYLRDQLAILEMDVLLAGGVSEGYLMACLEIWDRLMQDLVASARQALQPALPGNDAPAR